MPWTFADRRGTKRREPLAGCRRLISFSAHSQLYDLACRVHTLAGELILAITIATPSYAILELATAIPASLSRMSSGNVGHAMMMFCRRGSGENAPDCETESAEFAKSPERRAEFESGRGLSFQVTCNSMQIGAK
jgi:hypothetical protein